MIHTTIAHYKITEKIGKGGMGEVYRATDTKLDRDVAIKILPESFAGDRDRLARFNREAKALASLNHPNIAVIHGIEHHDDTHALVMELVEGETLGERLKREPMTVEEALDCCKQIAEALEAAHEKGIIHRDLKPENVKITSDGHVKVLDFGLAKIVVDPASLDDQAESPTTTHMMTTAPGELLGTAPYMSPEQARTRPVDKRSDIWSFGCVLFECLTGKRMFQGEDVPETLATIIKDEPDWAALPENTPPTIHLLLRKCLNKDRKRRLQHMGDARIDLEQALGDPTSSIIRLSGRALQEAAQPPSRPQLPLMVGVVLVLLAGMAIVTVRLVDKAPEPQSPKRLQLTLPSNLTLGLGLAISPNGDEVVAAVRADGKRSIYRRRMNDFSWTKIEGTESGRLPFYSDSGDWLAFLDVSQLRLMKVDMRQDQVTQPVEVCRPFNGGGSWCDDQIVYMPHYAGGLSMTSAAGEPPPITLTEPDRETQERSQQELGHWWPQILPGGKTLLYTAFSPRLDQSRIVLYSIEAQKPLNEALVSGGLFARYVSTGHLIFARADGILYACRFDLDQLQIVGPAIPVLDDIYLSSGEGYSPLSFSNNGTLAYVPSSVARPQVELVWVDRMGRETPFSEKSAAYNLDVAISPDGHKLAVSMQEKTSDIWIIDVNMPTNRQPVTLGGTNHHSPAWYADSKTLVFVKDVPPFNLFQRSTVNPQAPDTLLFESDIDCVNPSVSPDGNWIIYQTAPVGSLADIWFFSIEDQKPAPFLLNRSGSFEGQPVFSPAETRQWFAYTTNQSGELEVRVQEFPEGENLPISQGGAHGPAWGPDGRELFFLAGKTMMAAVLDPDSGNMMGTPTRLFELSHVIRPLEAPASEVTDYAVHPDGKRFLIPRIRPEDMPRGISIIQNWFTELNEKCPLVGTN